MARVPGTIPRRVWCFKSYYRGGGRVRRGLLHARKSREDGWFTPPGLWMTQNILRCQNGAAW